MGFPIIPLKDPDVLLTHFFHSASDYMCIAGKNGYFIKVNKAFQELLLEEEDIILSKPIASFIHPQDRQISEQLFDLYKKGVRFKPFVNRYLLKNGRERFLLWTSAVLIENEYIVAIARDVTDEQKKELERKDSELKLSHFIDLFPHPVFVKDKNFKYILTNKAQENLYGSKREDIVGKQDSSFISNEEEMDAILQSDREVLLEKKSVTLPEQVITNKNGVKRILITTKIPFESLATGETNILGVSIDITELKQTERELKLSNFELDNFVYHSSHDLRAPLSSLLGLLNLLERDSSPEIRAICIEKARSSIGKLDLLISELTEVSRNNRLGTNPEEIKLASLIDECFKDLEYMEGANKLRLMMDFEKSFTFISDRRRIQIIFMNIISNAIKYQDAGKDSFLKVSASKREEGIEFIFEDNGIGIEDIYQQNVFNMFFRASEQSTGSGLGLYIVKQSLEKLNGTIEMNSIPSVGTKFKIVLSL